MVTWGFFAIYSLVTPRFNITIKKIQKKPIRMFCLITLSKQYRYSILDFEKLILIKVHSSLTSKLQNLLAIGLYAHTCVCGGGWEMGLRWMTFFVMWDGGWGFHAQLTEKKKVLT